MNKIGFILSGLLTLLGFVTLIITTFINAISPKIGHMAFNAFGGSYSPSDYEINFAITNTIALLGIIIGIILAIIFYKLSLKERDFLN